MISNPDPSPNPDPEPNPYPNTNSTHSPCTLTNRLDSNTFVFFLVTSNQNHQSMCVSIFIIFNQSWGLQPSAPSFILNSQCLCCTTGFLALPRRAYVYTKIWSNLFFVLCAHEPRDKLLVWTHVHIMEANVPKSKWIYDKAKSPARQYNRPCLLAFCSDLIFESWGCGLHFLGINTLKTYTLIYLHAWRNWQNLRIRRWGDSFGSLHQLSKVANAE